MRMADAAREDGITLYSVSAYRSYTTFLIGHLLLEVSAHGAQLHPDEAILDDSGPPVRDLSEYPHLARLQPRLSQDRSTAEFEEALEAMLDRIELLLARRVQEQPVFRFVQDALDTPGQQRVKALAYCLCSPL